MKRKIKKFLIEGIKFVVILTIAVNAVSYYRSLDLKKDSLEESSFRLMDNSIYQVKTDKPLLIYFWATWCPVCEFQSPNIEKISKDYEVVTIATQSGSKEEIESYLKKNKLTFRVVNDADGFYSKKFNIEVFPTTLIYDREKNYKFSEVGYTSTAGLYSRMKFSE